MRGKPEELIAVLVLSALAIATMFFGIEYILIFHSILVSYGNSVSSIIKYMGSVFTHELKSSNTSTYTVNTTKFYVIYFSLNDSEINSALNQTAILLSRLNNLSSYMIFTIISYVAYLFSFFIGLCDLITRPLIKKLFGVVLFILSFFILFTFGIVGLIVVLTFPSVILTLLYSLSPIRVPFDVMNYMPEILIFGLDLAMFLVVFISEYESKISENFMEKIKTYNPKQNKEIRTTCQSTIKYFVSAALVLDTIRDTISIIIKIYVIVGLILSISVSILAYYNEAFLALDTILSVSAISFLVSFASTNLGLDVVLYFYVKVIEMIDVVHKWLK